VDAAAEQGGGENADEDTPSSKYQTIFNGRGEERLEEKEERFWTLLIAR
jgi:hypothetical protein